VAPAWVNDLLDRAASTGVPATVVGHVGGERIRISIDGGMLIDELVADAERIWSTALEGWFERRQAIA
jgi:hypothetical protein